MALLIVNQMALLVYTPTTEDGALFIPTTKFFPFKDSLGKDTFLAYSTDKYISLNILQVLSHSTYTAVYIPHLKPSQITLTS